MAPSPAESRPSLSLRITLVFAAALALWLAIIQSTEAIFGTEYSVTRHIMNALLVPLTVVPMILLARCYLDRRPWNGLRLPSLRSGWRSLLLGMTAWLIPAGLGVALGLGTGWFQITLRTSFAETLGWTAALLVLVFLYEALPEELVFRGYLYRNLSHAMPVWSATMGQALLFCLFGSALWVILGGWPMAPDRIIVFWVLGLVLGYIRVVTDNLWPCIGFHLAFQTAAQLLLGSEHFVVVHPELLQLLGLLSPFVLSPVLIAMMVRKPVTWGKPEPEEEAAATVPE